MSSGRAWAFGLLWALSACGGGAKQAANGGVFPECTPVTCAAAGKNCGTTADGCGRTLECGTCPAGQSCGAANVCVAAQADGGAAGGTDGGADGGTAGEMDGGTDGGVACTPRSCIERQKTCGAVPDGCGGLLACGSCPTGQVCTAENTCAAPPPACVPTTCAAISKNCGALADGCGGTLECGGCSGGETCGGAGTANVCGPPPLKSGDTRWVEFIDSGVEDMPENVATDDTGNTFVAGYFGVYTASPGLFLQKRDGAGKLVWEKLWASTPNFFGYFSDMKVSPSGSIFLAVGSTCAGTDCSGPNLGGGVIKGSALVKLGASGAFEWQIDGVGGTLSVDASDGVAVNAPGADEFNSEIRKYDQDRHLIWKVERRGYGGPFAFDRDGSLAVAGHGAADLDVHAPILMRLDADGTLLWSRSIDGYVSAIGTTAIGTIVALEEDHLSAFEPVDGSRRFQVPLPLWTSALGVDPAGRAAVVGQDHESCHDLAVRYYSLDGTFLWSRLIGALGSCEGTPRASAVTIRSGDVVLSGTVTSPTDFGTGVYDPKDQDAFVLDLLP